MPLNDSCHTHPHTHKRRLLALCASTPTYCSHTDDSLPCNSAYFNICYLPQQHACATYNNHIHLLLCAIVCKAVVCAAEMLVVIFYTYTPTHALTYAIISIYLFAYATQFNLPIPILLLCLTCVVVFCFISHALCRSIVISCKLRC